MVATSFYDIYCVDYVDNGWSEWSEDAEAWEWQGDTWQDAIQNLLWEEDYEGHCWSHQVVSETLLEDGKSGIMVIKADPPSDVSWPPLRKFKALVVCGGECDCHSVS